MGIRYEAFGRVQLTDEDARKFNNQVTFGRPSNAAKQSVKNGIAAVQEFKKSRSVKIVVKNASR